MKCRNCGKELSKETPICKSCGKGGRQKKLKGTKPSITTLNIVSTLIGIGTIIGAFVVNVYVIPLGIIGIILGAIEMGKYRKSTGLFLSILGLLIIVGLFFYYAFIYEPIVNPVEGKWNCHNYTEMTGESENSTLRLEIKNDGILFIDYVEEDSYLVGDYSYEQNLSNPSTGTYDYYNIKLNTKEVVIKGSLISGSRVNNYELAVPNEFAFFTDKAIFTNRETNSTYNCYLD